MIFRFDDISPNTDMDAARRLTEWLADHFPEARIMWCISPLAHDCRAEGEIHQERVYPRILNAKSDYRNLFRAVFATAPECPPGVIPAAHGLWHIDHRLLDRQVQEASILTSCSLANSSVFVPPFNKWNRDTVSICAEHGVELIKFESGWKSMEHEVWDDGLEQWYLHPRFWTVGKLERYMEQSQ